MELGASYIFKMKFFKVDSGNYIDLNKIVIIGRHYDEHCLYLTGSEIQVISKSDLKKIKKILKLK